MLLLALQLRFGGGGVQVFQAQGLQQCPQPALLLRMALRGQNFCLIGLQRFPVKRQQLLLLQQLRQPVAVVEAGHPVLVEALLILLVEVARFVGHQALHRHRVRRALQGMLVGDAVAVQLGELLAQRVLVRVGLEIELARKAVVHEGFGRGGILHFQQAHVQPVMALVHPLQRGAHGVGWHQDAQPVAADGAFDGTAPCLLAFLHLDQFSDEGQVVFG